MSKLSISIAAVVFLVVATVSIRCEAAGPTVPDSGQQEAKSQAQIDGICSRVVDHLWTCTDYWWHHGDYPRVIALDRIITEADPHFMEPYATGGWLMESLGDNVDAETYYKMGVTNNPQKSYMWHNLGMFYFNTLKDYPEAVATFEQAVTVPDAGVHSWKMLAHSYERNQQLDKAVDTWKRIKVLYPEEPVTDHNLSEDLQKLQASQAATGSASP